MGNVSPLQNGFNHLSPPSDTLNDQHCPRSRADSLSAPVMEYRNSVLRVLVCGTLLLSPPQLDNLAWQRQRCCSSVVWYQYVSSFRLWKLANYLPGTHIYIGASVALRSCSLVINRRLYIITRGRSDAIATTKAQVCHMELLTAVHWQGWSCSFKKHRQIIFDLSLTLGLPLLIMSLCKFCVYIRPDFFFILRLFRHHSTRKPLLYLRRIGLWHNTIHVYQLCDYRHVAYSLRVSLYHLLS